MGTDIHGVWQKRSGDEWIDISSNYEQDRHYQLFAALAGVRNGYGFAGVPTGQPVVPISEPRGYPDDFELIEDHVHAIENINIKDPRRQKYSEPGDDDYLTVWMGDHSHSWLTGSEMLAWYENAPSVVKTGIVERAVFHRWDGKSAPESYCGGVAGPNVIFADNNALGNWTHIRVNWTEGLKDSLAYFFDEVYRLVNECGEIRFVFGFDS